MDKHPAQSEARVRPFWADTGVFNSYGGFKGAFLFTAVYKKGMKMKRSILLFMLLFALLTSAFAQEGILPEIGLEITGDASIFSQYIWRGFVLDRDAVAQPSMYISNTNTKYGKVKIGVWSNQDLQNSDNLKSEEYDYIFDYTYDFGPVALSLGHTYYDFVDTSTFSREAYVGVTLPKVLFTPSFYFYRDYGSTENGGGTGDYFLLSGAYSKPVFSIKGNEVTLDLSAHVGFNHNLFIDGDGGDVAWKVGLTVPLAKNLKFTPNVNYSIPFGDLSDESHGNQKSRFYGGGTLVYAF